MNNPQKTLSKGASCPCCLFVTSDLFLPPSEREEESSHTPFKTAGDTSSTPLLPVASWKLIRDSAPSDRSFPLVVDTHGHAHLERESSLSSSSQGRYSLEAGSFDDSDTIVSLTCAVEPKDWQTCLEYAAQSSHRMAAIGVHPWYLADLPANWLQDLEVLLKQHPGTMVGEIGLCKMARFVRTYEAGKQAALQLQREVFVQQLRLAAKYQRPVSIHCVNQQGVLLDIFKEEQENLPPAMALHSFSGTAHHVKQLLQWESSLKITSSPLLYFGFSDAVNNVMSTSERARRQGRQAIQQVPSDRLLAESDVHSDAGAPAATAGAVSYLAWALEESLEVVADRTRYNGLRFLQRLDGASSK